MSDFEDAATVERQLVGDMLQGVIPPDYPIQTRRKDHSADWVRRAACPICRVGISDRLYAPIYGPGHLECSTFCARECPTQQCESARIPLAVERAFVAYVRQWQHNIAVIERQDAPVAKRRQMAEAEQLAWANATFGGANENVR